MKTRRQKMVSKIWQKNLHQEPGKRIWTKEPAGEELEQRKLDKEPEQKNLGKESG